MLGFFIRFSIVDDPLQESESKVYQGVGMQRR